MQSSVGVDASIVVSL